MTRLTDNDRHIGRFITYARHNDSWRPWRFVYSSGGGVDGERSNNLTVYAGGWIARIRFPKFLAPWRRWVPTGHYEWAKSPDAGYWDEFPREYGFSLSDGFLQVFMGAQTHDSQTTQSWCTHLPWTQWRHIRLSFFDGQGKHFWTEWDRPRGFKWRDDWLARKAIESACPSAVFEFDDYDGKRIHATCRVQELEWKFGTGWFKWLSLFRAPRIRRSLDIEFSEEVGPEKGSWKGGTLGHGIQMEPGESPEQAFRRYCDQEHTSKYQRFRITFVGAAA